MGKTVPMPDVFERLKLQRYTFEEEVRHFETRDLGTAYGSSIWWGGQEMSSWRRDVIAQEVRARLDGRSVAARGPTPASLERMRRLLVLSDEGLLGHIGLAQAIQRDVARGAVQPTPWEPLADCTCSRCFEHRYADGVAQDPFPSPPKGTGGTDFTPAFDKIAVDKAIRESLEAARKPPEPPRPTTIWERLRKPEV